MKLSLPDRLVQKEELDIQDEDNNYDSMAGKWFWLAASKNEPRMEIPIPELALDPQSATVNLEITLHCGLPQDSTVAILLGDHPLEPQLRLPSRKELKKQIALSTSFISETTSPLVIQPAEGFDMPSKGQIYLLQVTWNYQRLLRTESDQDSLPFAADDFLIQATPPMRLLARDEEGFQIFSLDQLLRWTAEGAEVRLSNATEQNSLLPECRRLLAVRQPVRIAAEKIHPVHQSLLHEATEQADVLYLCHPRLIEDIQPLVQWRREQGWTVAVIDAQQVYDEFGHGNFSPQAIKNFLIHTQNNWPSPIPQYVVLVGDSTYDPKNNLQQSERTILP